MAKRKTIQEKEIDALLTKHLDSIGRKIKTVAARNSKIRQSTERITGGSLRDSVNYRVKPYNVINLSQNYYGKYNTPKGKSTPSDRSNLKDTPLLNSIRENLPEGVNLLVKDIVDLLKSPIIKKK